MTTPTVVTSGNQGSGGNFTLTISGLLAGDRVFIGHMNDFYLTTNFNVPVCATMGSWTGVADTSSNPGNTNAMTGKIWYADVVTPGTQNISISTVTADGSYLQYLVLRGVQAIDGTPGTNFNNTAVSPHVANAVSPASADALLVVFMVAGNNGVINYTAPAGMASYTESDNPPFSTVALFTQALSAAGSTGTRTATPSATRRYVALTIAVSGVSESTTPVTSDLDARWRVSIRTTSDVDVRWRVSTGITSDLDTRWRVRNVVTSDVDARWRVLNAVQSDVDARWRVRNGVTTDLGLRWLVAFDAGVVDSTLMVLWTVSAEMVDEPDAVVYLVEFGSALAVLSFPMVEADLGDEL